MSLAMHEQGQVAEEATGGEHPHEFSGRRSKSETQPRDPCRRRQDGPNHLQFPSLSALLHGPSDAHEMAFVDDAAEHSIACNHPGISKAL